MSFSSGNTILCNNGMQAEVILASQGLNGQRPVFTVRVRSPRVIWPEFLTHRVFGRNGRSSRAVPFKTLAQELRDGRGFTPWHWTKNQPGMQGEAGHNALIDLPPHVYDAPPELAWAYAQGEALKVAEAYSEAGYHKQVYNRLLEPFLFIDALITATDWRNFYWLRDHKDTEPHFRDLAAMIIEVTKNAEVRPLEPGEWHLPYITESDWDDVWRMIDQGSLPGGGDNPCPEYLRRISAARCARVSYAPFDGNPSYERELERYDLLVKSDRVHASPLEHQATPDRVRTAYLSAVLKPAVAGTAGRGIVQPEERDMISVWERAELHGNLTGYIQARKLVPNECRHG